MMARFPETDEEKESKGIVIISCTGQRWIISSSLQKEIYESAIHQRYVNMIYSLEDEIQLRDISHYTDRFSFTGELWDYTQNPSKRLTWGINLISKWTSKRL